jgi:hypothetical protein
MASRVSVALALFILLCSPAGAQSAGKKPVLATPFFAFYSDVAANANDALINASASGNERTTQPFVSPADSSCLARQDPSANAGWRTALGFYARSVSPGGWMSRAQTLVRLALAGFGEEIRSAADSQFVEVTLGFLQAATPAYRACLWPEQDRTNLRWIGTLQPLLERIEARIATEVQGLYQSKWTGLPIAVDVVGIVDARGANSYIRDIGGGHLLIASTIPGPSALEIVFHEASHLLVGFGSPFRRELSRAAGAVNYRPHSDLWHVVMFHTTGDVVRRALAESGAVANYQPVVREIHARGVWTELLAPIEQQWMPYVRNERTMAVAMDSLIAALRRAPSRPP